jgi:cytochrome c oxidase subunit 2
LKALHRFCPRAGVSLSTLLAALLPSLALAQYSWDFPTPVGAVSRNTLQIHSYFMIIITILFVVVLGITIYSMFKHRKSAGQQPAKFAGPTGTVQWLWAMVPFAILLFIDYILIGIHFTG